MEKLYPLEVSGDNADWNNKWTKTTKDKTQTPEGNRSIRETGQHVTQMMKELYIIITSCKNLQPRWLVR